MIGALPYLIEHCGQRLVSNDTYTVQQSMARNRQETLTLPLAKNHNNTEAEAQRGVAASLSMGSTSNTRSLAQVYNKSADCSNISLMLEEEDFYWITEANRGWW